MVGSFGLQDVLRAEICLKVLVRMLLSSAGCYHYYPSRCGLEQNTTVRHICAARIVTIIICAISAAGTPLESEKLH